MANVKNKNQSLQTLLQQFEPINLAGLDRVSLLNRQDTKFILTLERLKQVLHSIKLDYKILEIEDVRINTYETLYYDSISLKAYQIHHNHWSNRYKVRFRKYTDSDLSFFEVKFKSNKNRTVKTRIVKPEIKLQLDAEDQQLLADISPLNPDKLVPRLWVYFKRITLVNKDFSERMTIDLDLQFSDPISGESGPILDLIIIEVKQPKFTRNSPIIKALKRNKTYPFKVSKYCLGIISLFGKEVKTNHFKQKLLKISKITANEYYRSLVTD